MESNYGPIHHGRLLNVEDVRQSGLGATWMDGVVVVRENQEMTNFKSHVIDLVAESIMVMDTMLGHVPKGKDQRELTQTQANP
jgi:hypothetical protein